MDRTPPAEKKIIKKERTVLNNLPQKYLTKLEGGHCKSVLELSREINIKFSGDSCTSVSCKNERGGKMLVNKFK